MKRNMKLYLQDIWESILAIEEYTQSISEGEFYSNRQVQDAVVRRLEIIGEAVKNIDDNFRNKYPQIPWKKIAGMRDIIAHEYFGVKLDRVWDVVKRDLPHLKQQILSIMEEYDAS
ncbi:MAG: DUF86 domain-containing protein [Methanosarcinales archaeon]